MTVTSSTTASQVYATNKTTATQAASAYESVTPTTAQQTDKMAQMEEKYKDVYAPIPETYSKSDEELQAQKIHEAYPNYISGQDFLKLADSFFEGPKIKFGQQLSPEEDAKQRANYEQAAQKAFKAIGQTEESFSKMQKDVQEIKVKYPINNWAKEGVSNAKELARFQNAAVYEGLESGLSLEDAKKASSSAVYSYMGTSANKVMLRAMPNAELGLEGSELFNDYVKYEKQPYNYDINIDLRESKIEGWWRDNDVYQNDNAMISEIQKKISQFNFMLNNSNTLQNAIDKLDPNSRPEISSLQNTINNEEIPEANLALKIFQNYNIYDSIDVKA